MTINLINNLDKFKNKLSDWFKLNFIHLDQNLYVIFFSYGNGQSRCKVWSTADKDSKIVLKRLLNFIDKYYKKNRKLPEFLKFDLARNIKQKKWIDVVAQVKSQKHNNHYRKGISFDEKFGICFLEQEIYAKSIIRAEVYNEPNFFDEKNLNDAIRKKYSKITAYYDLKKMQDVWVFDTLASFYEDGQFIDLHSTGPENGVRKSIADKKDQIKDLVSKNASFLHSQIQETGRFIYGYFPAYDREIKSYNTVRHCTAVYALLETLEVEFKEEYLLKIERAIEYSLSTFYKEHGSLAHMIDGLENQEQEVKLGSNAAAIFMFAKYQEVTGHSKYLAYAEKLAKGIQAMIDDQGKTTHILSYPALTTKEKFRIVYYDGEAALGLLRLYQINQDPKLLKTVQLMFEHFIEKKYDKYHDHWLSYCTNELTKICPEEKYFKFGLNNYLKHMKFIRERKTAYATFLEMMMSAYKMVVRLKQQGFDKLFAEAKFEELKELIELRVEFQHSSGFFYPEVAMYLANPEAVLNAFYVRHDRLRTRIDDQEHNLSGYVAYVLNFEN